MSPSSAIRWPAEFAPETRPVHVRNEIDLAAPPERAWAWLIRAALWPTWYSNAQRVRFLDGSPPDLALGTRFHWWTFSSPITSRVREFEPHERLAWDARGPGVLAYHAWLITPTHDGKGCHVLTEENQHGWAARLQDFVLPHRMHRGHQRWLEGLRAKAAGPLPSPAPV